MATTHEQVKVTVGADVRPYTSAMDKAAASTTKVDTAAAGLTKQTGRNTAAWAAVGAAATVAGAKMLQTINKSVQAASDLAESTTKMGVIFGSASGDIEKFASTAADSLGLSKRAALDAASTMATFGKAAGLSGQDLSKFSTDLVTLAGDLASFYNATPEEATLALGAALRGEMEPARRFGILLDDLTLRNKALEMGLISTTKNALTPQQKSLAAQAAIMEQTRDAQGDFARTSDGLANSQRKMTAAVEDAKAAFGEALLPVMTMGVKVVAELAETLAAMPEPLRNTVAGLGALTAIVLTLAPALIGASLAMDKYTASATAATGASGRLAGALGVLRAAAGPIGLLLTAVAAGAYAVHKSAEYQQGKGVDKMSQAMLDAVKAGQALDSQMTTTLGGGQTLTGIEDFVEALGRGDMVAGQTAQAFAALDTALASMDPAAGAAAYDDLATRVEGAGMSIADLNAQLPQYIDGQKGAAQAAAEMAAAEDEKASAVAAANQAISDAVSGMLGYINAMVAASGSADALLGAEGRLRAGMAQTTVTAAAGSKARAAATKAETSATDKAIAALRKKDAAETQAEVKAAQRRAQRKAEAAADASARKSAQNNVAGAIATDKAARAGKDIDGFNQSGTVGEETGSISAKAQKALDREIAAIRARHKKATDAQVKELQSSAKAQREVAEATGAAAGALVVYNNSLDKYTEAGRKNRASIGAEVTALTAAAQGVYDTAILNGATAEEAGRAAYDALIESRDGLIAMAVEAGYAKADVKAFFDEIKFTEKVIRIKFEMTGIDSANTKLDKLAGKLKALNEADRRAEELALAVGRDPQTRTYPRTAVPRGARYATGGEVDGPGTTTSDSIPAWLSRGEFIVNAPQYAANRELVKAINAGSGPVSTGGGMNIGAINVTEATPSGVRVSVLDALAESAYRSGAVR